MIIGTALIVCTWVVFPPLCSAITLWMQIVMTVIGAFIILFGATFGMYLFNLDMKLTSMLEPLFLKHYDKIKRDQHL